MAYGDLTVKRLLDKMRDRDVDVEFDKQQAQY